ncbi:MAG: PKD domain-containing protein [Candidatus Thermoplasmatota archaeon]
MRVVLVALLLLVGALAGCATVKDDDPAGGASGSSTSASGSGSGSRSATGTGGSATATGTSGPAALAHNATLTADRINGTAPLLVNFTINATAGASSWKLSFGDGEITNGTGQPTAANHTYSIGGAFTANLTVSYPTGSNATASLALTVNVPPGTPAPDVTHFEFAASLGCAGDIVGTENCISFAGGPDASGLDGYWQALDERYWGLAFTSTVMQGGPVGPVLNDSDCVFTDAAQAIIGEANNGGNPCTGSVPSGTAFIFIHPYATPALEMTIDFTV